MGHFSVVQELARRKAYTFLIARSLQVGWVATGISRSAGKTPWWYLINLGRVFKEPRQGISLNLVKDSGPSAGGLGSDLAAGTDGDCISAQAVATGVPRCHAALNFPLA